jgi:ribosomal protein L11 methylase PrmA
VWSGILHEGREEACAAAVKEGFVLESGSLENEWWAGIFRPEAGSEERGVRIEK